MWLIPAGLVLALIYVALKAPETTINTGGGSSNGTSTAGMDGSNALVPPDNSGTPYLGATGRPSPLTGGGSPQASLSYRLLAKADPTFTSGSSKFPYPSTVSIQRTGGTGVLNPLPDNFATKRLVTQASQPLPGSSFRAPVGSGGVKI